LSSELQKLRIDAARKIETIREKCRPSRAEDIIIIIHHHRAVIYARVT
jgi:hypothetical protein